MIFYISGNPVLATGPPEKKFRRPAVMMTAFEAMNAPNGRVGKRFKKHLERRRK
jgi:hypothetical protein